jgi:hypothetical protein
LHSGPAGGTIATNPLANHLRAHIRGKLHGFVAAAIVHHADAGERPAFEVGERAGKSFRLVQRGDDHKCPAADFILRGLAQVPGICRTVMVAMMLTHVSFDR